MFGKYAASACVIVSYLQRSASAAVEVSSKTFDFGATFEEFGDFGEPLLLQNEGSLFYEDDEPIQEEIIVIENFRSIDGGEERRLHPQFCLALTFLTFLAFACILREIFKKKNFYFSKEEISQTNSILIPECKNRNAATDKVSADEAV